MLKEGRIERSNIEVNITEHCNLRCAGCDHSSPHLPTKFMSFEDYEIDLEVLSSVLHVRELRLLGGEPLLHPELVRFLRYAEKSEICEAVTIITNGVLLDRAPKEMWSLIDTLIVSIYPGVRLGMTREEISEACKAHGIYLWLKETDSFRLAVLNNEIKDNELVRKVYLDCGLPTKIGCHTVHEGRYYKCSIAGFLEPRFAAYGIKFENRAVDGVRIRNNPNLKKDLEDYIASQEPLMGCRRCLGTSGVKIPHHQLNKEGLLKEMDEDHSNPQNLLRA